MRNLRRFLDDWDWMLMALIIVGAAAFNCDYIDDLEAYYRGRETICRLCERACDGADDYACVRDCECRNEKRG